MKALKKALCLFLAFVMAFGLLPATEIAAENTNTYTYYYLADGGSFNNLLAQYCSTGVNKISFHQQTKTPTVPNEGYKKIPFAHDSHGFESYDICGVLNIAGKKLDIYCEGYIEPNYDCGGMFEGRTDLKTVDFGGIDFSRTNNMSGMFSGCTAIEELDLSGIDASNCFGFSSMFYDCSNLKRINLDGFACGFLGDLNLNGHKDFQCMFYGCKSLVSLDLSSFELCGWYGYDCTDMLAFSGSGTSFACKKLILGENFQVSADSTGLPGNNWYKGTEPVEKWAIIGAGTYTWGPYEPEVSISLSSTAENMLVGSTKTLSATVEPSTATVTWSSSDTSVATVSSKGVVTAVKAGTATITAQANSVSATCKVTVTNPKISLNSTSATIYKGKTTTLTATTVPEGKTVTWKSSNTDVATVSSKGVVTAVKAGTATITASFSFEGVTYKATCKVTVKNPAISLSVTSATITKGMTKTLIATVSGSSQTVTWTSSDKSVATVSSKGVVTAVKAGTVTITAKANGVSATCKVTVKNPTISLNATSASITKGLTKTLTATVTGASKTVTWTSSDKSVATVSSKGVVTAVKAGTATITAKANGVTATCKVTVENSYKITYNLNGGTNSKSNPTTYSKSSGTITLKNPTKTGYTFAGWYTNSKFTGSKVTTIKGSAEKNYTLYAKWTANTYTVKFDANGGTGTMSSIKGTYNKSLTLTKNSFKHKTLYFDCWSTKADGTGKTYSNGASVKNLAASGTVTLYAQWRKAQYNLIYDANVGIGDIVVKTKYGDKVFVQEKYTIKSIDSLNLNTPSGKSFKEWNTKADGTGTAYKPGQIVTGLAKAEGATVTLYAQYYDAPEYIRASDMIYVYSQWDGYMYKYTYTGGTDPADWLLTSGCSYFAICHALQWLGLADRDSETLDGEGNPVANLPIKLVNLTCKTTTALTDELDSVVEKLKEEGYAKAKEYNIDVEHLLYKTPYYSLSDIFAMNGVAVVFKYKHWYLAVDISSDGKYVHIVDSCLGVPIDKKVNTYRFDTAAKQFTALSGDYSTVAARTDVRHYAYCAYDAYGNEYLTTYGPFYPNVNYAGGDYWVEYSEVAYNIHLACFNTLTKTELS